MRTLRSVTLLAVLLACSGSDPQPLQFVGGDDFSALVQHSTIGGGGAGDLVAYARPADGDWIASTVLRVLGHDAASPDEVELVGERDLGSQIRRVSVSGTTITALLDGGVVAIVDASDPALPVTTVSAPESPEHGATAGRWLLVASGTDVTLVDWADPSTQFAFVAPAAVTALLPMQDSFLAFTTGGYVHVAPGATAPTFTAVSDPEIRSFEAAFPDGAEAVVAGPATTMGRSRVVRLDLRAPAAPVVVRRHEVDGDFAAFAWDGESTSFVARANPLEDMQILDGYVVHEQDGAFTSAGIPLPEWRTGRAPEMAAHAGRLFALSPVGLGYYRLAR